MVEFIKKLQESYWNAGEPQDILSSRYPLQKKRLMVIYSPESEKLRVEDLQRVVFKSGIEIKGVLKDRHRVYEMMHSLVFNIDGNNTFKDIERFLKSKVKFISDIKKLKGHHYYVTVKEQKEIALALDPSSLKQFIEEQNVIQDREEVVYSLESKKTDRRNSVGRYYLHKTGTKLALKFFYNGLEIKNKQQFILEVIRRQSNMPYELYAAICFQLCEKIRKPLKRVNGPKASHEPCIEEKGYLFKGLHLEEQQVLSLCQLELNFDIQQIEDEALIARLKLLKLIHGCLKNFSITNLTEVKEGDLVNGRLEAIIKRRFSELSLDKLRQDWCKEVCCLFPYMVSKETRMLYFKICIQIKDKALVLVNDQNEEVRNNKRIKAEVDRSKLIDSGISIMELNIPSDHVVEISFVGESGVGVGPTLEFYALTALTLRSMKDLWRPMENETLFPAPLNPKKANKEIMKCFQYMGWLVARGINDERLVDLPFADLYWELILEHPLTLIDIIRIDKKIGNFLIDLVKLNKQREEIERKHELSLDHRNKLIKNLKLDNCLLEDIGLTFILQGYENIELKYNGSNTYLSINNLNEYLELTAHFTLRKTLKRQLEAFKEGFNTVFPISNLKFFKPSELENIICGDKEFPWEISILQQNIIPVHGYDYLSPQYTFFLKYLSKLSKEKQRLFLQYVTGSPRLPLGSFGSLNPKLSITKRITPHGYSPDSYLPSVMTCQNYIKVPEYSSYEALEEKFDYAISKGQGYFVLS